MFDMSRTTRLKFADAAEQLTKLALERADKAKVSLDAGLIDQAWNQMGQSHGLAEAARHLIVLARDL